MMPLIALFLIAAAAGLEVVFLLARGRRTDPVGHFALLAASVLLFATTIERSVQIRFVAVTNTFESLIFFAAVICLVLFIFRIRWKERLEPFITFGATMVALILLLVASSPLASREIQPPIPALQSSWLVLHVTFSFIGEAFFTVSFTAAIIYLLVRDPERRSNLDRIVATSVGIGYPIFTAGALIFGAIWAEVAWGSYWSWDPKETWALVTWLIYTAYLHTRLVPRLRGRISAILAIVGFVFTIFTYFGVNYLLAGLHSYG